MNNQLQIFSNYKFGEIRSIDIDGKAYFVGSDIAKALGYEKPANAISAHCRSTLKRGIPHPQSPDKLIEVNVIPIGDVCRLAANSELPGADEFELWIFDEVIPKVLETGTYSVKPMTQAELTAAIAQNQVELERKTNIALETANKANSKINNALDVFAAPPDKDWRQGMNTRLRGICQQYGLTFPVFFGDLYKELEDTARVDLDSRLSRLKTRLLKEGATKTYCNAVTKLEVIERDVKLRPIFDGIVRKYQSKYAIGKEAI